MSRQELQQGFYRFDDDQREILIDRYDTPSPWMNYLSNGSFTAMLSQAGGGLAFYRSPQIFRLSAIGFFICPPTGPAPTCICGTTARDGTGVPPANRPPKSRTAGRRPTGWATPAFGRGTAI